MKRIIPALGVCLAVALAGWAAGQTPATAPSTMPTAPHAAPGITVELLQHIQSKLKEVETVEADFVQEKNLALLKHTLTIRGHFALQKPDRLIWITREPVLYAISIQGQEVRQWDQDTDRVDVIHLGGDPTFRAVSEQIQAWFLGNYQELSKSYDVQVLGEKPLSLRFVPKGDTMVARILKQIDITFADDERYIRSMVVTESSGDTTKLQFLRTRVNQKINPDVWRIPPK